MPGRRSDVERVAKSRVSNRSDSKKSDWGRVGIPKSRIRIPRVIERGGGEVLCRKKVSGVFHT